MSKDEVLNEILGFDPETGERIGDNKNGLREIEDTRDFLPSRSQRKFMKENSQAAFGKPANTRGKVDRIRFKGRLVGPLRGGV